eukprot:3248798-Pleurochrysis_carterae.AAC.4
MALFGEALTRDRQAQAAELPNALAMEEESEPKGEAHVGAECEGVACVDLAPSHADDGGGGGDDGADGAGELDGARDHADDGGHGAVTISDGEGGGGDDGAAGSAHKGCASERLRESEDVREWENGAASRDAALRAHLCDKVLEAMEVPLCYPPDSAAPNHVRPVAESVLARCARRKARARQGRA